MSACILCISGSDSIAGAGMQIDVKTAAAHGVHACCAVTAVTAQNTMNVGAVHIMDPELVRAQVRTVFADVTPQAVKVGMLGSAEVVHAVAEELRGHPEPAVVLDPVLTATAGAALADDGVRSAICDELLALTTLVTPNMPEAAAFTGLEVADETGMQTAARALLAMGAGAVFVKGGHGGGREVVDVLVTSQGNWRFSAPRLPGEYHGTGCSLSTAIACNLARGASLADAVAAAHVYLAETLQAAAARAPLGHGSRLFDPLHRVERLYGAGVLDSTRASEGPRPPVEETAASP